MDNKANGLLNMINNRNEQVFTMQLGIGGYLSMLKVFDTITPEQEKQLEKYNRKAEETTQKMLANFLNRYGQETVGLHNWLDENLGKSYSDIYRFNERKQKMWTLQSWLDNGEQSEGFKLVWDTKSYDIIFESEDGYGKEVVVKKDCSETYLKECIGNWMPKENGITKVVEK